MQPTIPRRGSMQFWPRSRAKRIYPSLSIKKSSKAAPGVFGFAGYKAGMTHVMAIDSGKNSRTKGEEISIPVTILECPPLKVIGFRTYRQGNYGLEPSNDHTHYSDKNLQRKMPLHKKTPSQDLSSIKPSDFSTLTIIVATQPQSSGVSKKTPEVFEMIIGGTNEEKLTFAKENLGKDISLQSVFKEGDVVDVHGVSRGKGLQGPVKRFGVSLRSHKSEKTIRGPGSLGPWSGQQHIMYRVAHAGQTGFHTRTEYNKQILKIGSNPEEIAIKGDMMHYGKVKSTFVLVRGSTVGAKKRLVLMTKPSRLNRQLAMPTIQQINLDSKQ